MEETAGSDDSGRPQLMPEVMKGQDRASDIGKTYLAVASDATPLSEYSREPATE